MNDDTVQALNSINRSFYADFSDEFGASRQSPWPGWIRLLSAIDRSWDSSPNWKILDVGCGNGRFARFLAENLPDRCRAIRYVGVDASSHLLTEARASDLPLESLNYHVLDFVEARLSKRLRECDFDLAVLFGVIHHVPGHQHRHQLLTDITSRLRPGGLLALTAWQFQDFQRFRDKIVPWKAYNQQAHRPIALRELEPGDHLLPWGDQTGAVRYCHFANDEELNQIFDDLDCELVETFLADGREGDLNRYYVLRRSSEPEVEA
ncbi:class I SAM-dependent methyltransferase [Myxococcota bacterium]|nr:class I SAM-dependent methyltransferase [Myxococcota bacterium]